MTKKHFELLANALKFVQPGNNTKSNWLQWEKDIQAIAQACQQNNPRFDTERFLKACGY